MAPERVVDRSGSRTGFAEASHALSEHLVPVFSVKETGRLADVSPGRLAKVVVDAGCLMGCRSQRPRIRRHRAPNFALASVLDREREGCADHPAEHRTVDHIGSARRKQKRDCTRGPRSEEHGRQNACALGEDVFGVLGKDTGHVSASCDGRAPPGRLSPRLVRARLCRCQRS